MREVPGWRALGFPPGLWVALKRFSGIVAGPEEAGEGGICWWGMFPRRVWSVVVNTLTVVTTETVCLTPVLVVPPRLAFTISVIFCFGYANEKTFRRVGG